MGQAEALPTNLRHMLKKVDVTSGNGGVKKLRNFRYVFYKRSFY